MFELIIIIALIFSVPFFAYIKLEQQAQIKKWVGDQKRGKERKLENMKLVEEKLVEEKLAEEKLAEKKILADEELVKKIAVARRADKLELAQTVSCQIDLKKLRLAVAFFEDEERTSLVVEQNEQLHDSYVEEVKKFLEFDSELNSENALSAFIEDIKSLGVSLIDKSLNSDSFRSLLEGRDVEANNPLKSSDSEKVEDSDKQSKPLSLAQLIAVVGDSKVANETSQAALKTDPVVNGHKKPEESISEDNETKSPITGQHLSDKEKTSLDPEKQPSSWLIYISQVIFIIPFGSFAGAFLISLDRNYPFDLVEHVTESSLWMGYLLWPFAAVYLFKLRRKRIALESAQLKATRETSERKQEDKDVVRIRKQKLDRQLIIIIILGMIALIFLSGLS